MAAVTRNEIIRSETKDYITQKQKTSRRSISIVMPVLWNTIPTVWRLEGRQYLSTQWFYPERGFLSLECTKSFITHSNRTYALLHRQRLLIFHSYMLYQSPWKDSLEWKQSAPLLTRCADTWGTKGELFPNSGSSNTSLQPTHLCPILLEYLLLDDFFK